MPNGEKIELLISPEALKQFEQLKSASDANTASFEKLIAKAVELNKAVGNATTFKEVNKATKEMTENEKALVKQVDDLAKANAKLQALYTDEAKKIAEVKVQQQEQNKILKEQAKEALGLVDAYKKLENEYNQAAKEAKNLAAQFGAGSKQAQEASKKALELDQRLKAADANVGRFNRNVGNYTGALKTLENGLNDVNKRIQDYNNSGNQNKDVVDQLIKEQKLLESLVNNQATGFASLTQELRANERALVDLKAAGLEDSAAFKELFAQIAVAKDELAEFKKEIQTRGSGELALEGAIQAAQTLAGIYGIAQGAAAIFGNENEALQKTMVKLQAVVAVLNGLEAINNAIKKENALRTSLNVGLQRLSVVQTNLQTAAESKNIVVRYAAIAAQKALNFAMSAAGGPILAVVGLLALLVVSLSSFGTASQKAKRDFEKLNEEFEGSENLLNERVDIIKRSSDVIVAELESQFASEDKIRKARRKALSDENAELKGFLFENAAAYREAFDNSEALTQRQRFGNELSEEDNKTLEQSLAFVDKYNAIRNRQLQLDASLDVDRLNNIRETKEEVIKARQEEIESIRVQQSVQLQLQQSIAGDERKTQKQRIEALKESIKIQERLINEDANSKRLTPGLTPTQIKLIESQRTAALTQARRESNKAIEDLNRAYAERERKARFDIIKIEIEDQIKAADLIANNEKKSFDERTDALFAGYQKRRDIIVAQHQFDINNDTLTSEERIAIERKFLSDINNLTIEYGLQQQAIYQDNTDKVNDIIEKGQQGRLDKISAQQALELIALTESFRNGNITAEDYARQRSEIEQRYRIISLKEEVNNATAKVLATKEGTAARFEAEKELAEKTLALNDEVTRKQIEAQQALTDVRKQLTAEYFETFNAFATAQFDEESARIQQQMDDLDKQKEHEIAVANATIANKQEREIAIAKIEARAQAERERLERRQRQIALERARFEKASNIAQIISSTALAIIETLKTYKGTPQAFALAAAVGAIGALQLARAIAAPLPKFAEGTTDAPGGLAWVGDGGKKELVITPQGQVTQTPAVPTVMNVPRHSIVLPDARAALESGLAVNRHGRLVQNDNGEIKEVGKKIDTLTKVMRNKPTLNMNADQGGLTAIWKYGANWITYAEDQTRF